MTDASRFKDRPTKVSLPICCTFQELTESAYAMYSEMVFVTLDIDEFAHWASRFVPRDYHAKHAFGE